MSSSFSSCSCKVYFYWFGLFVFEKVLKSPSLRPHATLFRIIVLDKSTSVRICLLHASDPHQTHANKILIFICKHVWSAWFPVSLAWERSTCPCQPSLVDEMANKYTAHNVACWICLSFLCLQEYLQSVFCLRSMLVQVLRFTLLEMMQEVNS